MKLRATITIAGAILGVGTCLALRSIVAAPGSPSAVQFVDATEASGLRFRHVNSATPNKYLIETMSGGVALLDYNNDGWLDVFFVNAAQLKDPQTDGHPLDKSAAEFWNRLFRNNRDGTFTDVTEAAGLKGHGYGMGTTVGDYDGDGFTDLYVTNHDSSILYRNNGDGTFKDVTSAARVRTDGWTTSAGFFDYDHDGDLDLFVCRYVKWDFVTGSRYCGEKKPGARAYCHPNEFQPISNYLFRNDGNGAFTDVSEASRIGLHEGKGLGVVFADFNNDSHMDIYVANDSFQQFLFKNKGDGTFAEVGTTSGIGYTEDGQTFAGMGTDFADMDNDGFPDVITTALPYEYYAYYHNNGDGSFTYASFSSNLALITRFFSGWSMRIFDYDNDGRKDVFIANSHVMDNIELTQPHITYRQRPLLLKFQAGKFVDVSSTAGSVFSQAWSSRGAAFGDLDNDGDIDVVVSNCDGPAYFLKNEGGNRNRWVALNLRGRRSNREGLGARIALTSSSGQTHYSWCSSTGGYLSSNDRRVYFGLGQDSAVKEIRIQWPSGTMQVISNPPIDRILDVQEEAAGPNSPSTVAATPPISTTQN